MGFGGLINSVNKTEGYDFRQGASESGLLVNAGGSGAKDNATAITANASGLGSVVRLGTENNNAGNKGTINYGLPAGDLIKGLSDVTDHIGAIIGKQTDANTGAINATLAGLSDLALSKQTDGATAHDKTLLYVVGGVLALLALLLWRK
jgi:hypothetical protein